MGSRSAKQKSKKTKARKRSVTQRKAKHSRKLALGVRGGKLLTEPEVKTLLSGLSKEETDALEDATRKQAKLLSE